MGGRVAGVDDQALATMERFGRSLGLAFQIADDLLDETGEAASMGKQVNKDRSTGKLTWPAVAGLDASRHEADRRIKAALKELDNWPGESDLLDDLRRLSRYVIERTR
jgi:geranylgeranyl diphosphate synthase type II